MVARPFKQSIGNPFDDGRSVDWFGLLALGFGSVCQSLGRAIHRSSMCRWSVHRSVRTVGRSVGKSISSPLVDGRSINRFGLFWSSSGSQLSLFVGDSVGQSVGSACADRWSDRSVIRFGLLAEQSIGNSVADGRPVVRLSLLPGRSGNRSVIRSSMVGQSIGSICWSLG